MLPGNPLVPLIPPPDVPGRKSSILASNAERLIRVLPYLDCSYYLVSLGSSRSTTERWMGALYYAGVSSDIKHQTVKDRR